jgi:enoyl-CoA hydratase/carnithine racemase
LPDSDPRQTSAAVGLRAASGTRCVWGQKDHAIFEPQEIRFKWVNPMKNETIALRKEGRIAVVAFDAAALESQDPPQMEGRFADICSEIEADPQMQVTVITGVGDRFFGSKAPAGCAGPGSSATYAPTIVESAASLQIPVLIGLQGDIAGQPLELALACDIRIATSDSRFSLPQVGTGLIPFQGGTQRLPRIVGAAKALELILTGEKIDAESAYQIGLINRNVKPDELTSVLMNMAREMSATSVISLMYAKEAITKGMELTLEQGLRLEADLYFLMHTTKDRQEGIRAFREKRKPEFKGI